MAKEYIEREAAIKAIENDCLELVYYTREDAIQCVKAIQAADVAPVVPGRWIWHERYFEYECSACKCRFDFNNTYGIFDHTFENGNYCPNCGAKMGADTQEREDA